MKTLLPTIQHTHQEDHELIHYLKQTIDNICDRVRNKIVAPYIVLQVMNGEKPPNELVDVGIKEIRWLCYVYLPNIISAVEKKLSHYN